MLKSEGHVIGVGPTKGSRDDKNLGKTPTGRREGS